jgi:hypothetical protein
MCFKKVNESFNNLWAAVRNSLNFADQTEDDPPEPPPTR